MDAIPKRYETADAVFEGEDLDLVVSQSRKADGREHRTHAAEALYDVLDPHAAILDSIPTVASKS